MTGWGHTRPFGDVGSMSGLPPKAAVAKTGWEQSQQVALLLDHFMRKIAASSALLMHRMPHQ